MWSIPPWSTVGFLSSIPNHISDIRAFTMRSEQLIFGAFRAPSAHG